MPDLVYEASDYTAGLPVGTRELDVLIEQAGRPIARDSRKLTHFLTRVRDTVDSASQDLAGMRHRIEQLTVDRARVGTPTTLRPADALKFAAPEEIEAIVDRLSREQLARLRHLIDEAQSERQAVLDSLDRAQRVIREAVNDGVLDSDVAEQLLAELEDDIPDISRPAALDWDTGDTSPDISTHPAAGAGPAPDTAPAARPARRSSRPGTPNSDNSAPTSVEDTGPQETPEQATAIENADGRTETDPSASGELANPFTDTVEVPDAPAPQFAIPAPDFPDAAPFAVEGTGSGWADELLSTATSTTAAPTADSPAASESTTPVSADQSHDVDLAGLFDDEPDPAGDDDLDSLFDEGTRS